jgi:hypothetical protein
MKKILLILFLTITFSGAWIYDWGTMPSPGSFSVDSLGGHYFTYYLNNVADSFALLWGDTLRAEKGIFSGKSRMALYSTASDSEAIMGQSAKYALIGDATWLGVYGMGDTKYGGAFLSSSVPLYAGLKLGGSNFSDTVAQFGGATAQYLRGGTNVKSWIDSTGIYHGGIEVGGTIIKSNGSIVMAAGDTLFPRNILLATGNDTTYIDSTKLIQTINGARKLQILAASCSLGTDLIVNGAVKRTTKFIIPIWIDYSQNAILINKNSNIDRWDRLPYPQADSFVCDSLIAMVYSFADSETTDTVAICNEFSSTARVNAVVWGQLKSAAKTISGNGNYVRLAWGVGVTMGTINNWHLYFKAGKMAANSNVILGTTFLKGNIK